MGKRRRGLMAPFILAIIMIAAIRSEERRVGKEY